jgi:Na+/H+-dicarboxylate symporter
MDTAPTTTSIIISMLLGMVLGLLLQYLSGLELNWLVEGTMAVVLLGSGVFLAGLKLLVVPLVYVSLVCGVANLEESSKLGTLGGLTVALYVFTTLLAVSIAMCFAVVLQPGTGLSLPTPESWSPPAPPSVFHTILNFFPTNPVKAMADGNTMQIIVFAILSGFALLQLGERGSALKSLFDDANAFVMKMVEMIIRLAPYGVFCLMTEVFFQQGLATIVPLLSYFLVVCLVLAVQLFVVYQLLLFLITGMKPHEFFANARQPLVFAFSTASSNATIPVTLEESCAKFKVPSWIASFTIPLGATINMDGTAVMQGVATIFVAQLYQIDLTLTQQITVVGMATLASIGTAGVPGVGIVMLTMVFQQVGLPAEGIALILSVDRLLDMLRTAVNVAGDLAITSIVAFLHRHK